MLEALRLSVTASLLFVLWRRELMPVGAEVDLSDEVAPHHEGESSLRALPGSIDVCISILSLCLYACTCG